MTQKISIIQCTKYPQHQTINKYHWIGNFIYYWKETQFTFQYNTIVLCFLLQSNLFWLCKHLTHMCCYLHLFRNAIFQIIYFSQCLLTVFYRQLCDKRWLFILSTTYSKLFFFFVEKDRANFCLEQFRYWSVTQSINITCGVQLSDDDFLHFTSRRVPFSFNSYRSSCLINFRRYCTYLLFEVYKVHQQTKCNY